MIKLSDNELYVGTTNDLDSINDEEWAIVHATQTYYYKLFKWDRKYNKPDRNSPFYIIYEKENHLSLNWVDGTAKLYEWSGIEVFQKILDFTEKWLATRKVLIHCDQGYSRSPTLCLLYLAKRTNQISRSSFDEAFNDFNILYPCYKPSGIAEFVKNHWDEIK